MNASKGILIALGAVVIVAAALFLVYFVDIDQTEEARLPQVKVEGGNAPKFNVETGSVTVNEGTVDVPVPEVTVREESVEVPTGISINPPAPDGPAAKD